MLDKEGRHPNDLPLFETKKELVDYLYEQTGGYGKMQFYIFFVMSSGMVCCSVFAYQLSFLTQDPTYDCVLQGNPPADFKCDRHSVCDDSPYIKSAVISEDSIKNWMGKLDLYCKSGFQIGLISALYFGG